MKKNKIDKLNRLASKFKKRYLDAINRTLKGRDLKSSDEFISLIDIRDHIQYCNFFLKKKYKDCWRMQASLDSEPRDKIPRPLFDFVENRFIEKEYN